MNSFMDLTVPEYAYMLGFMHGDGHASFINKKVRVQVELAERDVGLLYAFAKLTPCPTSVRVRERTTNFANGYRSATWSLTRRACTQAIIDAGMPVGAKSETVSPPDALRSSPDYWRGMVDADGSIGTTCTGRVFLGLGTKSYPMALAFVTFCNSAIGSRRSVPAFNRRDRYINIVFWNEEAQQIARLLYERSAIALDRKLRAALKVREWVRPLGMAHRPVPPRWDHETEQMLTECSAQEVADITGRSLKAVQLHAWRLRTGDGQRPDRGHRSL